MQALRTTVRARFACDPPPEMRIDVVYRPEMLAHMLRITWPDLDPRSLKCLDMMVDDKTLIDHNARALIHHSLVENRDFVAGLLARRLPRKIAAEVRAIEKKLDTLQIAIRFQNGHICFIADSDQLSDYDYANLLMVYNLPPL